MKFELEFWQNHLAKLYIILATKLKENKDTTQIKYRIRNAEYELQLALEESN